MKLDLPDAKSLFIHIPTSLTKISIWVCDFDGDIFERRFFYSFSLSRLVRLYIFLWFGCLIIAHPKCSWVVPLHIGGSHWWNVNLHLMATLNLQGQSADARSFSNGPVLQWVKHYFGSKVHIGIIVNQLVWVKKMSLIDSIENIWYFLARITRYTLRVSIRYNAVFFCC